MTNQNKLLALLLAIIVTLLFWNPHVVSAQSYYCGGSGECLEEGSEDVCENSGKYCSGNRSCDEGERCINRPTYVNSTTESCSLVAGPRCTLSCRYGGFVHLDCGSPYYIPPAPAPTPPPNPTCDETGTCTTTPPPDTYVCDQYLGCILSPGGGGDYSSCQASCATIIGDPPTPAGISSCPDVQETATQDFTYPGETRIWSTWDAPPGATATERLANAAPTTMITKTYTSPGDILTVGFMWQTIESEAHSFYIYDADDQTFFFFVAADKPPAIFSRKQAVVDNAVKIGYTQITDTSGSTAAVDAAQAIDKRVYKLIDKSVQDNPWKDSSGIYGITAHAPYGKSLYHIPYVNCASLFNASAHKRYYSTNISTLLNDRLYCFRRQPIPFRFPESNPDDEFTANYMTGNYLGLELDWPRTSWIANQGQSAGSQVWPRSNLFGGSDLYKYIDEMNFATMETKDRYLARPGTSNTILVPAFLRQAVLQIPVGVFDKEGEHDLYAFIGQGDPSGTTPVPDEGSSQGCMLSQDENADVYVHVDEVTEPAACSGFQVLDSNGLPATQLRLGQKYTVKANARLESQIYSLYNSDFVAGFNATDTSPGQVNSWSVISNLYSYIFESVRCDINGGACAPDSLDNRMLRLQGTSSQPLIVESPYLETNSNLTGKTITVEFWAKTGSSNPVTISKMSLQRAPYAKTYAPYDEVQSSVDTVNLKFPVSGSATAVSDQFQITSDWQKFSATITFPYDNNYPTGHPVGNISSRIKLQLYSASNLQDIYYDNFTILGGYKPTVGFNMVPAADQCSQSRYASDIFSNASGGLFTGIFDTTKSEYQDLNPGQYYVFARLQDPYGKVYFGNPDAVVNCGITDPGWDDSIADTCMQQLELITCNETVPPTPSFVHAPAADSSGDKAYVGTTVQANYMPQGSSITKMEVKRIAATNTYQLPLRVSIPSAQASNVTEIEYEVYNMDHNGNVLNGGSPPITSGTIPSDGTQTTFDITLTPTVAMTNQIYVEVYAINGNSCTNISGLLSPALVGKIIIMGRSQGKVLDIPRDKIDDFTCLETTVQAGSKGASQSGGAGQILTIGIADPTTTTPDNYVNFLGEPFSYLNPLDGTSTTFLLPFNPNNTAAWRNQISKFEFTMPAPTAQDSYVCLECNQKDIDNPNVCVYTNNTSLWSTYKTDDTFFEVNYFITQANIVFDSWWQSRGGLVASIGDMESRTPFLSGVLSFNCLQTNQVCQPFLNSKAMSTTQNLTADKSAGVPYTNGDTLEARSYYTQNKNDEFDGSNDQPNAVNANTSVLTEDYDYFRKLFKNDVAVYNPSHPTKDLFAQLLDSEYISDGDTNLFVMTTDSSNPNLTLNPGLTVPVPGGIKIIMFVEGNLTISGPTDLDLIDISPGSFLMFVVQGDITFSSSVGYSGDNNVNMTSPVVEGIFLANDDIIVASKDNSAGSRPADNKFVAAGSFIALNQNTAGGDAQGVDLQRKFDDQYDSLAREKNSYSPIDMFIFRPDLVMNTPEILKRPGLTWKETN